MLTNDENDATTRPQALYSVSTDDDSRSNSAA